MSQRIRKQNRIGLRHRRTGTWSDHKFMVPARDAHDQPIDEIVEELETMDDPPPYNEMTEEEELEWLREMQTRGMQASRRFILRMKEKSELLQKDQNEQENP